MKEGILTKLCLSLMALFFLFSVFQAAAAEPFNVLAFGNFKRMIHSGETQGVVKLREISTSPGSYGLGALAGLRGEILLWDGKLFVSRGLLANGAVEPAAPMDEAVFFVEARVEAWDEVSIPDDMPQVQFESFVLQTAARRGLSSDRPFPFTVRGNFHRVLWHVVTGAATGNHGGQAGRTHSQGHANNRVFDQANVTGFLLGFYSGSALEGVISHPGERFHIHYADAGFSVSGHVDDYRIARGAVLLLPRQ
jgi:alpha-acetolactate decarboxylase